MLLEHVSKKEFASVFTTNYGAIVKDFIQVTPIINLNDITKFFHPCYVKTRLIFEMIKILTFLQFKMTHR